MTDDHDVDDPDAREEELARHVWAAGDPPLDPLVERVDPRVLTEDELTRVARLRAAWSWFGDAHAADAVRFLLGLVDRLTTPPPPPVLTVVERARVADVRDTHARYRSQGRDDARVGDLPTLLDRLTPPIDEVNRGTSAVCEGAVPVAGGGAARAAPTAVTPVGEPGTPLRTTPAGDVAPDPTAALLGELDGLRAQLAVLADDAGFVTADPGVVRALGRAASWLDRVVDLLALTDESGG